MAPDGDAPDLEGGQVGDYVLIRRIGSGGMGAVWLGRHLEAGTLGAVKRVTLDKGAPQLAAEYFAREARAVARLAHPHIVPVLEIGPSYLVTAFIEGSDLERRLKTPVAPAEAIRLVRQIADAVAHAHAHGVIHRDIKPSNVLVDARGNAYLTDFGLAAVAGETEVHAGGTPQFMAPEQRGDAPVGPAADQYSLARTLMEMLVGGRVPIDRDAALAELPGHLPDKLRALIERATEVDPGRRFSSMRHLYAALGEIRPGDGGPPRRLAPELRAARDFRWLEGAHTITDIGLDIERADYRLRELGDRGLLPAGVAGRLLERAALRDVGFAIWGSRARLGAITSPGALARASDVVILLHGYGHVRDVWSGIARAVIRDNAQALVLALDVHGFGESRFAGMPTREQASMAGLARTVGDLRRTLGVAPLPTVLVGHSMSGLAVLTVDDTSAGPNLTRIAITPVLPSHVPSLHRRYRQQARIATFLGRIRPLWRLAIHAIKKRQKETSQLVHDAIELSAAQTLALPPRILARMGRAVAEERPSAGPQRRVAVVIGGDDPLTPTEAMHRALDAICVDPAHRLFLPDGGHYPHIEIAKYPELSARNAHDLTRLIDALLVTAGDAPRDLVDDSFAVGSTLIGASHELPESSSPTLTRSRDR